MNEIIALDPLKVFQQIGDDCPKQLFAWEILPFSMN